MATGDFNSDGKPDYVLYNASTDQTVVWDPEQQRLYRRGLWADYSWGLERAGVADFNRDGESDYLLFNPSSRQTVIYYLSGVTFMGRTDGPTPPIGWAVVATGDLNNDGNPDYVLYNAIYPPNRGLVPEQQRLYRRGLWPDYSCGLELGRALISLLRC